MKESPCNWEVYHPYIKNEGMMIHLENDVENERRLNVTIATPLVKGTDLQTINF